MFIRRTTYRLKPDIDQPGFERDMRANIRPEAVEGFVSAAHVPNDDGSWTVVALWETKVEAIAALPRIRAEWDKVQHQLITPPIVETAGVGVWEPG
ncbi:hypothetical protein MALG_04473 (plasmid) [Marinovum algicola DG 898]|nr:hypothetical protein MALG_04473 [Marinovum algicola DG 898]